MGYIATYFIICRNLYYNKLLFSFLCAFRVLPNFGRLNLFCCIFVSIRLKITIRFFKVRFKTNRMAKFRVCLVENDLKYGHFLRQTFSERTDFDIEVLTCGNDCLEALDTKPDLICIDLALSDTSSSELLSKIVAYNANLSVLVFKVQDDTNVVVEFLKLGAADFSFKTEYLPDLQLDNVSSSYADKYLKNEVEPFGAATPEIINLEHFNSDKADSKIIRELRAIVELAGVLSRENKINIVGSNSLHSVSTNFIVPTEKTLREYTTDIIVYYLGKYNQNVVKVAEKLDIGKSTIYNMIKNGEVTLNK